MPACTVPIVYSWDGIVTKYHAKHLEKIAVPIKIRAYMQTRVLRTTFDSVTHDRRRGVEERAPEEKLEDIFERLLGNLDKEDKLKWSRNQELLYLETFDSDATKSRYFENTANGTWKSITKEDYDQKLKDLKGGVTSSSGSTQFWSWNSYSPYADPHTALTSSDTVSTTSVHSVSTITNPGPRPQ
ncbi:hypothetical protein BEWA_049340 [Theileria equi strain WA]|uniref:Uncharacterized protein n=1 Tax=Theileria equi strain WA TaxID=1537102 RepID=L1LAG3_THEEQ|nr:hypothetical protein BEWA_049340 [Theileria equi strain WA]EKX72467.1 hypothetical protein BEWA_049340 [Theileria equi strain WA]|eukprot:XP_004831919.1 hypothetical protein BEWA_049340 [Theileria equi strain WA]